MMRQYFLRLFFGVMYLIPTHSAMSNELPTLHDAENVCPSGSVQVRGKVSLDPKCTLNGTVFIYESGTEFDCRGAVIRPFGKFAVGIRVDSIGKKVENIKIKNCVIENAPAQGIIIGWNLPDRKKQSRFSPQELPNYTPHNVIVENVIVRFSGKAGIYVDDFSSNVVIEGARITDAGTVGIYLEHGSFGNVIRNNVIERSGRLRNREGVAIDASYNNTIVGNRLSNNKAGGVFLYTNCSEKLSVDERQVKRITTADRNKIVGNVIERGRVGIWIASRQSRDLSKMLCGNGYYAAGKYTLDHAQFNYVKNNKIINTESGIIVEDDNNEIIDNEFQKVEKAEIIVGSKVLERYNGRVLSGVVIHDNAASTIVVNGGFLENGLCCDLMPGKIVED